MNVLIECMTAADVAHALHLGAAGDAPEVIGAEFVEWMPLRRGAVYRVLYRDEGGIAGGLVLISHFSRGSMTAEFR
jgi:hypothetical protein